MNILVIQGSPDHDSFSSELAQAYTEQARKQGHSVETIDLSQEPDFDPVLRFGYRRHMDDETLPDRWQEQIARADHLSFFFPVWWAAEPAVLKGWVDRVFMPRFAYSRGSGGLLGGRTASIVTSCQGPAFFYRLPLNVISRWKRLILGFCGIKLKDAYVLGSLDSDKDTAQYREAFKSKVCASVPAAR